MFGTKILQNIKTHIVCSITFSENLSAYEMIWKDFVETGMIQMTIWHMCIARWTPKATHTHTQNMQHLLLFHCHNGCTIVPQCHAIRAVHCLCSNVLILCFGNYWQHCGAQSGELCQRSSWSIVTNSQQCIYVDLLYYNQCSLLHVLPICCGHLQGGVL
jgi:hypothetical protein